MLSAFSIMTLFVNVKDNNVEQAIRSLKKKMQREGLYKEMKLRKHFEKPCLKRAREKEENIRRSRKMARRNNSQAKLLTIFSHIFLASPNNIVVLSR